MDTAKSCTCGTFAPTAARAMATTSVCWAASYQNSGPSGRDRRRAREASPPRRPRAGAGIDPALLTAGPGTLLSVENCARRGDSRSGASPPWCSGIGRHTPTPPHAAPGRCGDGRPRPARQRVGLDRPESRRELAPAIQGKGDQVGGKKLHGHVVRSGGKVVAKPEPTAESRALYQRRLEEDYRWVGVLGGLNSSQRTVPIRLEDR